MSAFNPWISSLVGDEEALGLGREESLDYAVIERKADPLVRWMRAGSDVILFSLWRKCHTAREAISHGDAYVK